MKTLSTVALLTAALLAPLGAGAQQILTNMAPPAPIAEVQTAQPSPAHAWVAGYWTWNGTQYAWNAGHWEVPQQQGAAWDAPQWENANGQYRFRPGRWRHRDHNAAAQGVVLVQPTVAPPPVVQPVVVQPVAAPPPVVQPGQVLTNVPPPAPIAETQSAQPSPAHAWVAGYWTWSGTQYTWTAGHWEVPQQQGAAWDAPQWENANGQYRYRPGRWRRREGMGMQPVVQQPVVQQPVVQQPVVQQPVTVAVAPPRARTERRPRVLPNGQIWVPGYWSWNGTQHVWNAGHVEAPPQQGQQWVQPRWGRRGRQWVYTPGIWH